VASPQSGIPYQDMHQEESDILASPTEEFVNIDKKDGMRYDTKQSFEAPPQP